MTSIDIAKIASDIAVFADIGTDAPNIQQSTGGETVRFTRHGEVTELIVARDGEALVERFGETSVKHANFKALLASDRYGNLRDWASKQRAYLEQELAAVGSVIDVKGLYNGGLDENGIQNVDDKLVAETREDSTRLLLIDGPAGIGKTQFIVSLAARRVQSYATNRRPLILHVQSRGRALSYLQDMVAFSLQRLRLDVTYDQVPILAKYGLVTIAIDGFDELADPDGYDLAWSQVSDLVVMLRGNGTMILAGRETFIGRDRIERSVTSIRRGQDDLSVLTLQPPTKGEALRWLATQGWTVDQLGLIENYLEPTSLALRPFFLRTLANPDIAERLKDTQAASVLSILMEAMVEREIGKFGEEIEEAMSAQDRRAFLTTFVGEVARDMIENGTTAISDATLSWLVEASLPKPISDRALRILKARAQDVAFFTNDDRRSYRRFFHDKFYEYFLSIALIELLLDNQTGKVLSRTVLSSSLLETFGEVLSSGTATDKAKAFLERALATVREYPPIDRTRRNVAALAISCLSVADLVDDFALEGVDLEECRFSGTAAPARLRSLLINQIDCRGGDLSQVRFENATILTLIADRDTLVPADFARPGKIQDISTNAGTLTSPDSIEAWVFDHLFEKPPVDNSIIPADLRDHDAIRLLFKACRVRQYWLRRGDDVRATKILDDENWRMIEEVLQENGLLTVEYRQASGTDARFIHVRQPEDILAENADNREVSTMLRALVDRIRQLQA